jgi:hypothetical protein
VIHFTKEDLNLFYQNEDRFSKKIIIIDGTFKVKKTTPEEVKK